MVIDWINTNKNSAVTIYNNNITLSKQAASYFEDAYAVAIGVERETKKVIIRKINKEEFDKAEFEQDKFHKIEIRQSYGRINSKAVVTYICNILNLDFLKQSAYKFSAKWNTGYKMLVVDTNEGGDC